MASAVLRLSSEDARAITEGIEDVRFESIEAAEEVRRYLREEQYDAVREIFGTYALLQEMCGNQGRADCIWAASEAVPA